MQESLCVIGPTKFFERFRSKPIAVGDMEPSEEIIRRLEKENRAQAGELKRKDKKITSLEDRLDREDSLWTTELGRNRHKGGQPARLLHIHETLDHIISDDKILTALTRIPKEIFDDTLADLHKLIKMTGDTPHFRDDGERSQESGNRCKLYVRHFLLMTLVRKAHNLGQRELGAFFGIDQSNVSRYLGFALKYDDKLYPTPDNITNYISNIRSREEFKEIVPGRDGGELTVDGTLVERRRPEDNAERKIQYSGKKKRFAISTAMLINKKNYIVGISDSREGSCHDLSVLTQGLPNFGRWTDRMIDGSSMPDEHRIHLKADGGYAGIRNCLPGICCRLPHKKPRNGELTETQKAQNKAHSQSRIHIENVFAHIKNWKRMSGRYEGTAEEFNAEFNGICGMYNKRKMWKDGTYHRWKKKIMCSA